MIIAHCQPLAGTVTIVTHLEYPMLRHTQDASFAPGTAVA